MITINDNGTVNAGSIMAVDVAGDSDSGNRNMGLNPVHAVQQSASQILVVNQSNSGLPQDSVSKVNFSGTSPNPRQSRRSRFRRLTTEAAIW